MDLLGPGLDYAQRVAESFMETRARLVEYERTRVSGGTFKRSVVTPEEEEGEPVDDTFPFSFAPVSGEEAQDFFRQTGKQLYGGFYPATTAINRKDTLEIDGVVYEVVMTSDDQTDQDVIQHYLTMVKR